jgi:cytoskeletal protein CcmA (bactofilin family)
MAMFKKDNVTSPENTGKSSVGVESIIAKDVIVRGDVLVKGAIRVDGMLEGNVEVSGNLFIGKTGFVKGIIHTDNFVIAGRFEGNVEATSKVTLNSSGKLWGDIVCRTLLIEDGAIFQGTCSMVQENSDELLPATVAPEAAAVDNTPGAVPEQFANPKEEKTQEQAKGKSKA